MKRITLLLMMLFAMVYASAQNWTAIDVPNGDFADSTTVKNIAADWVVNVDGEVAARETDVIDEVDVWCGTIGYTGAGVDKRGSFLNYTGAKIPASAVEYKLNVPNRCSWIAKAKIDSFPLFVALSAWDESADSSELTVIATDSIWVSQMADWNNVELVTSIEGDDVAAFAGKQLVIDVKIGAKGMKGGAEIGTVASWIHFTNVTLEYMEVQASSLQNTASQNAKVYMSQSTLCVEQANAIETNIAVYDISGKLVKAEFFNAERLAIDMSDGKAGIYLVRVANEKTNFTQKLMLK